MTVLKPIPHRRRIFRSGYSLRNFAVIVDDYDYFHLWTLRIAAVCAMVVLLGQCATLAAHDRTRHPRCSSVDRAGIPLDSKGARLCQTTTTNAVSLSMPSPLPRANTNENRPSGPSTHCNAAGLRGATQGPPIHCPSAGKS